MGASDGVDVALHVWVEKSKKKATKSRMNSDFTHIFDECCIVVKGHVE